MRENCRLVVNGEFFKEPGASIPFSSENRGLAAQSLLTQAFVLREVNSPRNATQGGTVAFVLN